MADLNYDELVDRAKEQLPDEIANHDRFVVPEAEVLIEGKKTVLRNFGEIADALKRDPEDVYQFLQKEVGTAATLEGRRIVFKGKLSGSQLDKRIRSYVETYVLCAECGLPDTRLVRDGRTLVMECDACGAKSPVSVRKKAKQRRRTDKVVEGGVYEVMIQDIGKLGDGVAKKDDYVIFVPGTAKGDKVKAKIEKISGNRAFARVVRD